MGVQNSAREEDQRAAATEPSGVESTGPGGLAGVLSLIYPPVCRCTWDRGQGAVVRTADRHDVAPLGPQHHEGKERLSWENEQAHTWLQSVTPAASTACPRGLHSPSKDRAEWQRWGACPVGSGKAVEASPTNHT